MIISDTSAWISFFKGESKAEVLKMHIVDNDIIMHPFIFGELLLGGISEKTEDLLLSLPMCRLLDAESVYKFIRESKIHSYGIGWVDVNLVISAIRDDYKILTFDAKLQKLCKNLDCSL